MPAAIPQTLAAYILQCLEPNSQTLITSVLSTPAPWLTLRLAYAAIFGAEESGRTTDGAGDRRVIFLSLIRPLGLWIELGKKIGFDIATLQRRNNVVFIDGLASDRPATGDTLPPTIRLLSHGLKDISAAISQALRLQASIPATSDPRNPMPTISNSKKSVIIIDGIDIALAARPDIDSLQLQQFLSSTRTSSHALILSCQSDSPLLHGVDTPLEVSHANFLTTMAHQSSWVLQLRGLDTGPAKDVTGVLRVSRGAADEEKSQFEPLSDGEWLYQVKGDGSVRVWGRGE